MKSNLLEKTLILGFMLGLGLIGCSNDRRTADVARLMAEINELASDENQSIARLPQEIRDKITLQEIDQFPSSRPRLELAVKEALPYYDRDIQRFRLIAEKYAEMESLGLNEKALASVTVQKKLFAKYAEGAELQKARLVLILDPAVGSHDDLMERTKRIELKLSALGEEIRRLEQQRSVVPADSFRSAKVR